MSMSYRTKKAIIELQLSDNRVKITNLGKVKTGRVYYFHADQLYQVMKFGSNQQMVQTYGNDICVAISFSLEYHISGKHISSAGNGINTYIHDDIYTDMMKKFEEGLDDQFSGLLVS